MINCYKAVMATYFNTILLIGRSLSIGGASLVSGTVATPSSFLAGYACLVVVRIRNVLKIIIIPIIEMSCFHGLSIAKWPKNLLLQDCPVKNHLLYRLIYWSQLAFHSNRVIAESAYFVTA